MPIKQNMKRRVMAVLALAMVIAVLLTAGVAQAAQRPLTLSMSASADAVGVGEPVSFTITETNNQPFALDEVGIRDSLPANVEFVSATPSQGTCTYGDEGLGPNDGPDVWCNLGTLASGATAYVDVVVIPTEPGTITNTAIDIGEGRASASVEVYPY